MSKIFLATNGSQGIQLIRDLFALNYRPDDMYVLSDNGRIKQNNCFLEFLEYYGISFCFSLIEMPESTKKYHYGICLSSRVIFPKEFIARIRHFINFHPGLLPDFRGSNSTVHALAEGTKIVGGTWHRVEERVDCGAILSIVTVSVKNDDTAFSLNHKIFKKGMDVLGDVLDSLESYYGFTCNVKGRFFYSSDFPDLSSDKIPLELKQKIYYFPPKFLNYEF